MKKQTKPRPMTTQAFAEAVDVHTDRANGKRRTRLIGPLAVAQALREALASFDSYGFVGGGRVANAYQYPASQSAVYSIQIAPKVLAVVFGEIGAKGGVSETTWATGCSRKDIAGQRLSFGPQARDFSQRYPHLIVSSNIAWRFIHSLEPAVINKRAAEAAERESRSYQNVLLTEDLSLKAGNCFSQTHRVAELIGKPAATVAEVLAALAAANMTHLESFVLRAARFAARQAAR